MPRRFVTLDVFTTRALAGNPLAVVLDAEGLDTAAMQKIAGEFNLSETVFVLPPDEARHRARLRIGRDRRRRRPGERGNAPAVTAASDVAVMPLAALAAHRLDET